MDTYKDHLTKAMTWLGEQPDTCVIGYNVTPPGGSGGSTFDGFPLERRHEMPLAEALMAGVATGMALDGWVPVLWFERADFMLHAADQIVNHLDKLRRLSRGLHKPGVIIRVNVGNKNTPLFTGPCHVQDFSDAFIKMVGFPIWYLKVGPFIEDYKSAYNIAKSGKPIMLFEYKDLHNT